MEIQYHFGYLMVEHHSVVTETVCSSEKHMGLKIGRLEFEFLFYNYLAR